MELETASIFPLFKELDADVWFLFDACRAMPQAFDSRGKGVASVLAATGFEAGPQGTATEVGPDSFTHFLTQTLGMLSNPDGAQQTSLRHSPTKRCTR